MSQTTKEEILAAAIAVLRSEGPECMTQTRVAREVGVSQGHLTYYFPKKDDLWRCVAKHAFTELEATISDGLLVHKDLRSMLTMLTSDVGRTQLYISLCLRAKYDDDVGRFLREDFKKISGAITKAFGPKGELLMILVWGLGVRQLANGTKKIPASLVNAAAMLMDETTV